MNSFRRWACLMSSINKDGNIWSPCGTQSRFACSIWKGFDFSNSVSSPVVQLTLCAGLNWHCPRGLGARMTDKNTGPMSITVAVNNELSFIFDLGVSLLLYPWSCDSLIYSLKMGSNVLDLSQIFTKPVFQFSLHDSRYTYTAPLSSWAWRCMFGGKVT